MGSLKAQPIGLQHVNLKSTEEHFTIERPNSHVKNLIFGTMYIEHVGNMIIRNYKTGEVCIMEFKAEGWGGKNKQAVEGYVYSSMEEAENLKTSKPSYMIWGTWTGTIQC